LVAARASFELAIGALAKEQSQPLSSAAISRRSFADRSLLGQVGSLSERAELLRRGDSGVLKVAATPHMIESVLSTFLLRYAERYPKV
jgi:hypothetical protein